MRDKEPRFKDLPKRLDRLIWARGISQSNLARVIKCSPSVLSKYLSGDASPTPERLKALANTLNVDWRVLIGELPLPPDVAAPEPPPDPSPLGHVVPHLRGTSGLNESPPGRIVRSIKRGQEKKP